MFAYYSDHIQVNLPEGHRFPIQKYALLRQELLQRNILLPSELISAPPASRDDLLLAHNRDYVDSVLQNKLSDKAIRQIGLPMDAWLVDRTLSSVGATIAAAEMALKEGCAGNLGGGTHHARAGEGAGFCIFNDLAVTVLRLRNNHRIKRVAIIDLDVHQGNGTAEILYGMGGVFLLSIHGEKNYPFRKVPSTMDIGLPDHTSDEVYLDALETGLKAVILFNPQVVLYQAGVDLLGTDQLGRLSLTLDGLAKRDTRILDSFHRLGVPIILTMGGGYSNPIELTVNGHVQTYAIAKGYYP
jgi:acetoin utilization deacetylase AcuC-like enzyme